MTHVVALRALGLGDLLTAVPALRALRRAQPDATISLLAPRWLEPLVGAIGAVDRLLPVDGLTAVPAAVPAPARGAALAVNLHGRGSQSTELLRRSGPGRLLAYADPQRPGSVHGPRWDPAEHEVVRWCRLLEHAGIATDPTDLHLVPPAGAPWGAADGPPVVIHLGASSAARRWPTDRWAAVAGALRGDGHRILLTGDRSDRPAADHVAAAASLPPEAVLTGRTALAELIAGVAHAALVLVGDTGVAHLASACGTPSVVLFGPVSPAQWGPPPGPHRALWAGRRGDPHGMATDPGLLELGVAEVLAAARELLLAEAHRRAARSPRSAAAGAEGVTAPAVG